MILWDMDSSNSFYFGWLQEELSALLSKVSGENELLEALGAIKVNEKYICPALVKDYVSWSSKSNRKLRKKFTDTELKIIRLITDQHTTKEVAEKLNLSFDTIKGYKKRIFEKIECRNVAGLVKYAVQTGLHRTIKKLKIDPFG